MITYEDFDEDTIVSPTCAEIHHLEKLCIAQLSSGDIALMTDSELAEAIRASQLPLDDHVEEDLEYYGRDTLERLMFLAREMCRHQCPARLC